MDLNWLDDVLALLEEGNMTRAAQRRNITQPAFSRRIRSFENWLGIQILERGPNSITIHDSLLSNEAEIRALASQLQELRGSIANHSSEKIKVSISAQHATTLSTFPDMALRARHVSPGLKFRLRAANFHDCVSMFLRGDTDMMLCYEVENAPKLEFGPGVRRETWGVDYLVPVIGGSLRYTVKQDGSIPEDTPAIVYPENSYFGQALTKAQRIFGTPELSANPVYITAFSSGIRELALAGLGAGWVPLRMVIREIEKGDLISVESHFGREPLEISIFANKRVSTTKNLLDLWAR